MTKKKKLSTDDVVKDVQEKLEALMPPDCLMRPPWVAGMQWALGEPKVMEAFSLATGIKWKHRGTQIERMIDRDTGFEGDFILSFARWFNANIWGEVDGRAMGIADGGIDDLEAILSTDAEAGF